MTTTKTGAQGYAPKAVVTNKPPPKGNGEYTISKEDVEKLLDQTDEQKKYIRCWDVDSYRKYSPGAALVDLFLETAKPPEGATIVDWGCGSGKAAKKLYDAGLDVTCVDFAFNALDDELKELAKDNDRFRFIEHDLSQPITLESSYGYCCDVMEHIPPDEVSDVLDNILDNSRHVFFQICTENDHFGEHPDIRKSEDEKEHLHLTVKPYQWWLEQFVEKQVVVHQSNVLDTGVIFYLTGWSSKTLKWDGGELNTDPETVIANMKENAKLGLQQVKPHSPQDTEVMLLAGGPSLNDFTDEIIKKRAGGMPLITTNGSYNWAIENGMKPSMQCVIDAREFNKRFARPVMLPDGDYQGCQYFISSQCHPETFKGLPKEQTFIWQVSISDELVPHVKEFYGPMYSDRGWFPCPGGSTVTLRAICLLRMLGFSKIHIYGMDSCVFPDDDDKSHHAYEQVENDNRRTMEVVIGGGTKWSKTFTMEPWQVFQLREMQLMIPRVLKDAQIAVYGPGAIAYMIQAEGEASMEMPVQDKDLVKEHYDSQRAERMTDEQRENFVAMHRNSGIIE